MSLVNVAYAAALTWANPTLTRLEDQALVPMYGEHPIELGLDRVGRSWLDAFERDAALPAAVRRGVPAAAEPVTRDNVVKAHRQLRARDRVGAVAVRSLSLRPRRRGDLGGGEARRDALPQPAAVVLHLSRRRPLLGRDGQRPPIAWRSSSTTPASTTCRAAVVSRRRTPASTR